MNIYVKLALEKLKSPEEPHASNMVGKQTRLKRDHNKFNYYNLNRSFERAGKNHMNTGTHTAIKTSAYYAGVADAYKAAGLKIAITDDVTVDGKDDVEKDEFNPAEALAKLLQNDNYEEVHQIPDNVTKKDDKDGPAKWGPRQDNQTGAEDLAQKAPMYMPQIGSV